MFVPLSKNQKAWIAQNLERTGNAVHSYVFGPAVLHSFRAIMPFVARLPRGKLDAQTEALARQTMQQIGFDMRTEQTRRIVELYSQFLELSPKTQASLFSGMTNAKTADQKQRIAQAIQKAINKNR